MVDTNEIGKALEEAAREKGICVEGICVVVVDEGLELMNEIVIKAVGEVTLMGIAMVGILLVEKVVLVKDELLKVGLEDVVTFRDRNTLENVGATRVMLVETAFLELLFVEVLAKNVLAEIMLVEIGLVSAGSSAVLPMEVVSIESVPAELVLAEMMFGKGESAKKGFMAVVPAERKEMFLKMLFLTSVPVEMMLVNDTLSVGEATLIADIILPKSVLEGKRDVTELVLLDVFMRTDEMVLAKSTFGGTELVKEVLANGVTSVNEAFFISEITLAGKVALTGEMMLLISMPVGLVFVMLVELLVIKSVLRNLTLERVVSVALGNLLEGLVSVMFASLVLAKPVLGKLLEGVEFVMFEKSVLGNSALESVVTVILEKSLKVLVSVMLAEVVLGKTMPERVVFIVLVDSAIVKRVLVESVSVGVVFVVLVDSILIDPMLLKSVLVKLVLVILARVKVAFIVLAKSEIVHVAFLKIGELVFVR